MSSLRIRLLEKVLQSCAEEYSFHERIFAHLDTKAQSTTAISGIFLAAALAFLHGDAVEQLTAQAGLLGLILVGLAILGLIVSVVFALVAMRVQTVPAPLAAADKLKMVDEVLSLDEKEFDEGTVEAHLRDRGSAWPKVLEGISKTNDAKAQSVWYAQCSLAVSILFVGLMLLIIVTGIGRTLT